jgi:Cu(I)/Ag(I) efflux system periplasmic protein CusF
MKLNKLAAALALSVIASSAAFAQDEMVKGVVKKIDAGAGKITLTSGPIKSLDMDEDNMTMVFRVKDPAMLKQVKVGDKVQFEAGLVDGQIAVTSLQNSPRLS